MIGDDHQDDEASGNRGQADGGDEVVSTAGPSLASRGCGLIGCVLVLALLGGLGAGAFVLGNALEPLADRYLWAPHDVLREYFAASERGDTDRQRRFQCAGVAGLLDPLVPFGARLGSPFVDDEFPYPRAGGRIAIYYRVEQRGGRAQVLIEREDEGWRVCEFVRS